MSSSAVALPRIRHQGPHPGILAIVHTVLFLAGLGIVLGGKPSFPTPWESAETMAAFFTARSQAALACAFFQFGAAIVLGLFTVTVVNQLRFLGVRAAGAGIALFGGLATALNMMAATFVLWTMAHPGIAQDPAVLRALYYVSFAFGGPGFSVPLGLLMAGVCVPAHLMRLLPRWVTLFGLALAVCGELSWLNLIFPQAVFLIPLTRFFGFVWLIAAGFLLPRTVAVKAGRSGGDPEPHAL